MTIEKKVLRKVLREWIASPASAQLDYSADPLVQRRVGRILAEILRDGVGSYECNK